MYTSYYHDSIWLCVNLRYLHVERTSQLNPNFYG